MDRTFEQWLTWMESCHPVEIELGLQRCRTVLDRLMDSKLDCPIITVAGTNGKGSTLAVLEALARQSRLKPLLYTSPHILDYRERLKYNGHWLTKEQHIAAFEAVESARGDISLTYFEFATLAALKCAEQLSPDVLLLETGLGGRLDAVNVLDADIAIITTVDYDHQDWLGDDLISIAREKAGIVHPGKIAIVADPEFPEDIINEIESKTDFLLIANKNYHYQERKNQWSWQNSSYGPWQFSPLNFPVCNAAAALQAWSLIGFEIELTETLLQRALAGIDLSCRFDRLHSNPDVILDVAHNPQAIRSLVERLQKQSFEGQTHLVTGMLDDKNVEAGFKLLAEVTDHWYLTDLPSNRGRSANSLKQAIKDSEITENKLQCYPSPIEAYKAAYDNASSSDRIIVTGSFYTVAPVLDFFQKADHNSDNQQDPERKM